MIALKIKMLKGGVLTVSVDPNATVQQLKEMVQEKEGVAVDRQRIIYKGKVLKNEQRLSHFKIEDGDTVHMVAQRANTNRSSSSSSSSSSTSNCFSSPHHSAGVVINGSTTPPASAVTETVTSPPTPDSLDAVQSDLVEREKFEMNMQKWHFAFHHHQQQQQGEESPSRNTAQPVHTNSAVSPVSLSSLSSASSRRSAMSTPSAFSSDLQSSDEEEEELAVMATLNFSKASSNGPK